MRAETRALVEKAMGELHYVYNRAAANLRGADVGLIGLVINDLRNPFFTEFAASAQMTFAERGYATVIANTDETPAVQAQVIASMIEHGVSGFLISPAYVDAADGLEAVRRAGLPAMQVLRRIDARTDEFPFASLDYEAGGRLAAEHLLGLGLRRIAFVGGIEGRPVTEERMAGYRAGDGGGRAGDARPARPALARLRAGHGAGAACPAPGGRGRDLLLRPRGARDAGGLRAGRGAGRAGRAPGRLRRHRGMRPDLAAAELGPLRHRPLRPRGGGGHARLDRGRGRARPPRGAPRSSSSCACRAAAQALPATRTLPAMNAAAATCG